MSYTPVRRVQKSKKDTILGTILCTLMDLFRPNPCLGCKQKREVCPTPIQFWKLKFHVPFRKTSSQEPTTPKPHVHRYHRPYFTMWLMLANTLILITALCSFQFAPIGTTYKPIQKTLLRHNLAYETITYMQQENFWIGPDYEDLIHFGAKYSPCMRHDKGVISLMAVDRRIEDKSGCCVRRDLNVCWQTQDFNCTSAFSTFYPGKVCGLGRETCTDILLKSNATLWAGKLTTWPNCPVVDRANVSRELYPWLGCEVSARPCCVGLQGECVIVSEEECQLRNGYFHENHTLCAHGHCVEKVCGIDVSCMYQFYRIFLPTFIHSGILHLITTLLFLNFIVNPVEQSYGWFTTATIYIMSGACGTLCSAFFTPYQPEVGPSGSLFGIIGLHLARDVVEIRDWYDLRHMVAEHQTLRAIVLLCLALILFLPGLLPWIDNWSHLGGLVFGFFISMAVLPHNIPRTEKEWCMRVIIRTMFLVIAGLMIMLQIYLFYFKQDLFAESHWPSYFNCIPFTKDFCQDSCMELRPRSGI